MTTTGSNPGPTRVDNQATPRVRFAMRADQAPGIPEAVTFGLPRAGRITAAVGRRADRVSARQEAA